MKKVLVVDDTKNIRTLLTKCLQMEGYEVKTANDGYEAVEIFSNEAFDLAFLDIKMPYFSGTEVLKQIRERGITTPVIIITAYATIKNAVECTQMDAVAYLQKPFTSDKVRNVLSELNISSISGTDKDTKSLSRAEAMLNDRCYSEALDYLRKLLPDMSLVARVYMLLSKASEALDNPSDAEKYMKIYETLK